MTRTSPLYCESASNFIVSEINKRRYYPSRNYLLGMFAITCNLAAFSSSAADLALNRPVTASSAESGYAVSQAVDGNSTTLWSSQATQSAWITVDLGSSQTINEVKLNWAATCGQDYTIEVSTNGSNWTVIKTVTGNTTAGIKDYTGLSGAGRYVRMNGSYGYMWWYGWGLRDFEVYGSSAGSGTGNLALNKSVTTSSIVSGYPGSQAVDGNAGTIWSSQATQSAWITVDLGSSQTITEVKLNWDNTCGQDYTIEVSANGLNWTVIKSVTGNTTAGVKGYTGLSGTGRYVRMNGSYGYMWWYGWGLKEFEVYGTATVGGGGPTPPQPVVNVAATDSVATIQSKLNSLAAGGSLVFPAGSSFNFGSQSVTGKNGITVWADGVVNISGTGAAFNFEGKSSWSVRGKSSGQGFVFSGNLVNATSANGTAANPWSVGNCTFKNQPSNGYDGSAVRMTGSSFGLVINNDFISVGGNTIGMFNWDNITVDGNTFTNCYQMLSLDNNQNPDTSKGRNIKFLRNTCVGLQRAGIEVGAGGNQYFSGMVVDNNWFDDFGNVPTDQPGSRLAISLVGQASVNTTVTNNFIRVGSRPESAGKVGVAIEFTGTGECTNNVIWNFAFPVLTYQSGWNIHDNRVRNDGTFPYYGFVNNGSGTGTFGPETILSSAPPTPAKPTRIVW